MVIDCSGIKLVGKIAWVNFSSLQAGRNIWRSNRWRLRLMNRKKNRIYIDFAARAIMPALNECDKL